MKSRVRILEDGAIIEFEKNVADWIGQDGQQSATVEHGGRLLHVIDRDADGAIFGLQEGER
jgi:hypothetical protein